MTHLSQLLVTFVVEGVRLSVQNALKDVPEPIASTVREEIMHMVADLCNYKVRILDEDENGALPEEPALQPDVPLPGS